MSGNLKQEFSQIYDDCIDKIYRFVYFKVNSDDVAQDICSEAFLRGWQAFKSEKKVIDNPQAFLYQIARNLVIDHYREKGKSQTVSIDVVPLTDTDIDLEEKVAKSSDMDMIRTCLTDLKEDYQEIVVWHYIDDYSIPEIAQMVDKSEGAVRVMLHRALKSLKDKVNKVEEA
jgi:RNA polymerase sigma-70 factor, ECF subfamily